MIEELKNTPNTMVGFRATGEITKEDFDSVVLPAVHELVQRTDKLNYLLVLDAARSSYKIGEWLKDAMVVLNEIGKWNRAAIVSDWDPINTGLFKVVPGDFRTFTRSQLDDAIQWAGEQNENGTAPVFAEEEKKED